MKYIIIIISFLFFSCTGELKQHNKNGMEFMKQGLYSQAIIEFNNAISIDNSWLPPYYNRAISYANTQNYKNALNDLDFIIVNFPHYAQAYLYRGVVYENMGAYANAIQDYSQAINVQPDFLTAYHYRGIARFNMKDYDGALIDYDKALELGLKATGLYFNRGVIMFIKGNMQAAINDYTEAINVDPSYAQSYYNRAIAKMSLQRRDEAFKDLEIASRLGYNKADEVIKNYFSY